MTHELAKTLTTALVQFIDRERPEGTMCCSNIECGALEEAFKSDNLDDVEAFIQKKLSRLTEFEQFMDSVVDDTIRESYSEDGFKDICKDALALAKKQLLSYADESNPAIEAMADLERTFECNPDKLPLWLQGKLGKKHLEGYIMGREDTMREMKDFIESHFNTNKAKEGEYLTDLYYKEYVGNPQPIPTGWGCDGTHCTNPQMDCINCPRKTTGGSFSTSSDSGTSAATLHGNTSVTDGKPHNPSFTD